MLYRYIYIGGLIIHIIYIYNIYKSGILGYIYKYISQKVAICSLWTVCPCFSLLPIKFEAALTN